MILKYFYLIFLFTILELFTISDLAGQWAKTFCEDSLCLYFNGTSVYAQSNEEANDICSRSGLMLLEIPNASVQAIVDKATASWDNYDRPLNGFYFRLNLVQFVQDKWSWLDIADKVFYLDSSESIPSYPHFAVIHKNSSGIYYGADFERSKHISICACEKTCRNPTRCLIRVTDDETCYEIYKTASSWFESRSYCQSRGGDLARVFIRHSPQWIVNFPEGSYWIGLMKARYVWSSTGKTSNYFKWFGGEPIEGHNCTYISHSDYQSPNYFRKAPCVGGKPFVCMTGSETGMVLAVISSTTRSSDPSNFEILSGVATFGIAVIVMGERF